MTGSSSDDSSDSSLDSSDSEEELEGSESESGDELDIADCIDLKIGQAGVSALAFHSSDRRLACGTIDGRVRIYDTEGSLTEPLVRGRYHRCVRCVAFHGQEGASQLLSASSLGAFKLHDARTGGLAVRNNKARDCGINCLLSVNPDQFVTGDEDGWVSLFDLRRSESAVLSLHVQADWKPPGADDGDGDGEAKSAVKDDRGTEGDGLCGVGHISMLPGHVLAACEDGTLTTVSLNKRKVLMKSEFFGQPLTCVWPMKGGSKVVAGTESGSLLLFNRGQLANISDKCSVLEPAGGIEGACPLGPDILVCACSDSRLHAVSVLPHSRLACLGRQPSDTGACLRVAADPTGALLASASPESSQIRLWSAGRLTELQQRAVEQQRRNPSRRKRRAGLTGHSKVGDSACGKLAKQETTGFLAGLVGK